MNKSRVSSGLQTLGDVRERATGSTGDAIRTLEALLIAALGAPVNHNITAFPGAEEWQQVAGYEADAYLDKLK